jgi:hypothetical protein
MTHANLYAIFFGIFVIWFSLPFSFSSVCSLVLDYFAGDAFVAGDIDHIDAGRKGTHTEMGVGTADHLAGGVVDSYFLVLRVDDFSTVERDRTAGAAVVVPPDSVRYMDSREDMPVRNKEIRFIFNLLES